MVGVGVGVGVVVAVEEPPPWRFFCGWLLLVVAFFFPIAITYVVVVLEVVKARGSDGVERKQTQQSQRGRKELVEGERYRQHHSSNLLLLLALLFSDQGRKGTEWITAAFTTRRGGGARTVSSSPF